MERFQGRLNNKVTRFGTFVWGEDKKIREALQKAREQFWPEKLPVRFKIKL